MFRFLISAKTNDERLSDAGVWTTLPFLHACFYSSKFVIFGDLHFGPLTYRKVEHGEQSLESILVAT